MHAQCSHASVGLAQARPNNFRDLEHLFLFLGESNKTKLHFMSNNKLFVALPTCAFAILTSHHMCTLMELHSKGFIILRGVGLIHADVNL